VTFGSRSRALVLVAIAMWFSGAASAGSGKTVTEELLDILLRSGTLDESQYEDLKERARTEEQQRAQQAAKALATAEGAAAAAETPAVSAGPEDWAFKWSNGFKLERNDGAFKLAFGGRIQNDWAVVAADSDLKRIVTPGSFDTGNGTEFRRARIYFAGTLYDQLFFKSQVDFAEGDVDFKDVYLGLKGLGPVDSVKVGHMKEPFSLEAQTSSKYVTFMERALPNVFSPSRNTGLMVNSTLADKKILWQLGGFRDSDDFGDGFSNDDNYNLSLRLVGVPYYENEGEQVVHLGLGYSHQFRQDYTLRYRQRPESHLADRIVDTRMPAGLDIPTSDVDLINPELAVVWGPAAFQAEFMHAFVNGDGVSNLDFWGSYAEASYFLTGEHRSYDLGKGRFGRLEPRENFSSTRGNWGAWQVAARFSYLDLDDEFVSGGKVWDVSAGLNWYPFPSARVTLNYVHSHVMDRLTGPDTDLSGDADIAQARFQIEF
jgi:phosphate-selective porin OprO/OprP